MEYFILITFLLVFGFMYWLVLQFLKAMQATQDKFYDIIGEVEVEHLRQLDKNGLMYTDSLDRMMESLQRKKDVVEEQISRIDHEFNSIEKEDQQQDPLEEMTPAQFANLKNVQFEGEEEIFPVIH